MVKRNTGEGKYIERRGPTSKKGRAFQDRAKKEDSFGLGMKLKFVLLKIGEGVRFFGSRLLAAYRDIKKGAFSRSETLSKIRSKERKMVKGAKRAARSKVRGMDKKSFSKKLASVGLIAGGILLVLAVVVSAWFSKDLPSAEQIRSAHISQSTEILDRNGKLLYKVHGDENRTLVELKDIPVHLQQATIVIEDDQFYDHPGVDVSAFMKAALNEVFRGVGVSSENRGGSTITQQLIKNTVVGSKRTYSRKIQEIILSLELERSLGKDQILELYLNQIPYGSQAFGAQAASQRYFAKDVKDLTLSESAVLAAIPNAPSRLSPHGSHTDLLINRQQYILERMADLGYVTKEEAEDAKKDDVLAKVVAPRYSMQAPHFVFHILNLLEEQYGKQALQDQGFKVYTTLDLDKQKVAEEVVKEYSDKNLEKYGANNMSLVSIDVKSGQVLSFVGSRDYYNKEIQGQVSIPDSVRQPGSSFKPLVYLQGFEEGYTPRTTLFDVSTDFGGGYRPKNYSGDENGPVDIRRALGQSLNIPAVKMGYLVGVNKMIDFAKDLGYENFEGKVDTGLSLALGSREVRLLDHAAFYAMLANDGKAVGANNSRNTVLKIENGDGKTLWEYEDKETRMFGEKAAQWVNSILSDSNVRLGGNLSLDGREVASKTGTTNDNYDAWTMGYTPEIATGVWAGNTDRSTTKNNMTGLFAAAPAWKAYMDRVLEGTPPSSFEKVTVPDVGKNVLDGKMEEETVTVCKSTGKLATPDTPESQKEEKNFKTVHSILYYIDKRDPLGPYPEDGTTDSQFNSWEDAVKGWIEAHQGQEGFEYTTDEIPTETCDSHSNDKKPQVTISSPTKGQKISAGDKVVLKVDIQHAFPVKQVDFYVAGGLVGTRKEAPYELEYLVPPGMTGSQNVLIKVFDEIDNLGEATSSITVQAASESADDEGEVQGDKQSKDVTKPKAGWLSPANSTSLTWPAELSVKAEDPESDIRGVYFYCKLDNRDKFIGSDMMGDNGAYSVVWNQGDMQPGSYVVYALAINGVGLQSVTGATKLNLGSE